jgi:hypothetical protein
MIRVYCDSNIFRLLKERHPSYSPELKQIFEALRDKFLFIFSDAHLDDLKDSTNIEYLEEDLAIIEAYAKDNYFSYDHSQDKSFKLYLAGAKEAFYNRDYEAAKRGLDYVFDSNKIFEDLGDEPYLAPLKEMMNLYMNQPISTQGLQLDHSLLDDRSRFLLNKVAPGFHNSMSLREFLQCLHPFTQGIYSDPKELTELRRYAADYYNRDDYSFEKWGLEFDSKLKDSAFGKPFLELVDSSLTEDQLKDDQYRFCHAYALLEMQGITQERDSKNKLKKFTFDSLHRDATHAYFASLCDYLVTDDKGLQVKAHILYSLFGYNTRILSRQDFINSKSMSLANEETWGSLLKSLDYDLKHSFQVLDKINIADQTTVKEFKITHPYFNYFTRLQIVGDEAGSLYALFCRRHKQANFIMYREIELLVTKLLVVFGIDSEGKGPYLFSENDKYQNREPIRTWTVNDYTFELLQSFKDWGFFLALTIEPPKAHPLPRHL